MKRFNRREKWLIGAPLLCLMVPAAVFLRGDGLDRKLRGLAGPGAIDCGAIYGSETAKEYDARGDAMEACADQAYDSGQPFYMRQWVHMDGIKTTVGYYGTPGKKAFTVITPIPRGFPVYIEKLGEIEAFKPTEPIKSTKPQKHPPQKNRYWLFR